jgi:hypothetical protein
VHGLGSHHGLHSLEILNAWIPKHLSMRSRWEIFSRDPAYLDKVVAFVWQRQTELEFPRRSIRLQRPGPPRGDRVGLWTDDYSDLLAVIR